MICKFCGNQIEDNSDFCFICGQKVGGSSEQGEPENTEENKYFLSEDAQEEIPAEQVEELPEDFEDTEDPEDSEDYEEPEIVVVNASKFVRLVSFLFAIIGFIIYAAKKKKGKDGEAISILNAIMTGLCVKMSVLILFLFKKFVFTPAG